MRWQLCPVRRNKLNGNIMCNYYIDPWYLNIHLITNQNKSRKIINKFFSTFFLSTNLNVHLDLVVLRRWKNYVAAILLKVFCHIKGKIDFNTSFNIRETRIHFSQTVIAISPSISISSSFEHSSSCHNNYRNREIIFVVNNKKKIESIKRINYTKMTRDKIAWKTVTVSA